MAAALVHQELRRFDGVSALSIESLILELLAQSTRDRYFKTPSGPPHWLRHAKDFCHDNFAQPISLFDVAETIGMNPTYLARIFRKYYRLSVGQYIRQLRLEHAIQELDQTDKSIIDIALSAGFFDQSHFTNAFKHHMGITP